MTRCSQGDVVFVPFMFSDKPVAKRRPAVVLSSDRYHQGRHEMIIAAVTSNVERGLLEGDHKIEDWQASGLPKPSTATAILRTLRQSMILRTVGALSERDLRGVKLALARALDL